MTEPIEIGLSLDGNAGDDRRKEWWMTLWQIALITLVAAWSLQALGTYMQMRHYSAVMGEVSASWPDGYVGTGNARSRFGAGVILLLVVSPDRIVRRLLVMQGRSVFARFNRIPAAEGQPLAALESSGLFQEKARGGALSVAIQQIEKVAARTAPA